MEKTSTDSTTPILNAPAQVAQGSAMEKSPSPVPDVHVADEASPEMTLDAQPPSFAEAVAQAEAVGGDSLHTPPDYFDISIVPTRDLLMRSSIQPMEASTAAFRREANGVVSHDELLQSNPDELYRFLMTHLLEPPVMTCHIRGEHTEYHTVTETTTNSDGSTSTTTRTESKTVEDFSFNINVSPLIMPDWHVVFALPKDAHKQQRNMVRDAGAHMPVSTNESGLFRQTLEEFTQSQNLLKEIQLEKEIVWDYAGLRTALETAIRQTGYRETIRINFHRQNHIIRVHSSHVLSRMAQSCWTWFFLTITCLWIIFLPLYFLTRKKVANRLVAHFHMKTQASDFYYRNIAQIMVAAMHRRKYGHVLPLIE
ncbi:hypothetical protein HDU96_000226 [Phlyctochytrium bullatum]|nr:hypothetical protein HDU96_000226 [Phlyctochytrium bullatum]